MKEAYRFIIGFIAIGSIMGIFWALILIQGSQSESEEVFQTFLFIKEFIILFGSLIILTLSLGFLLLEQPPKEDSVE